MSRTRDRHVLCESEEERFIEERIDTTKCNLASHVEYVLVKTPDICSKVNESQDKVKSDFLKVKEVSTDAANPGDQAGPDLTRGKDSKFTVVTVYKTSSRTQRPGCLIGNFAVNVGDVTVNIKEFTPPLMQDDCCTLDASSTRKAEEGVRCLSCPILFQTWELMLCHYCNNHNSSKGFFNCPFPNCPSLVIKSNTSAHLRHHFENWQYKCSKCSFSTRKKIGYMRHDSAHKRKDQRLVSS